MPRWLKNIFAALGLFCLALGLLIADIWPTSFVPANPDARFEDSALYKNRVQEQRGKILAVVTSADQLGDTGQTTGYELVELSRAYYVFQANGFEVDIVSPEGGKAPMVIDDEDMSDIDFAFLNDPEAMAKAENTLRPDQVKADDYAAVYYVGGKGAMFDFPDNQILQSLSASIYEAGGVVAAICHGPAALVNVQLSNGDYLVDNKRVNSFTNEEELFLKANARDIYPFLLEEQLSARGGLFEGAPTFLEHVAADQRLITGQNPWSVWALTEAMISELGYTPVARETTALENSVALLQTYMEQGYGAAAESFDSERAYDPAFLFIYTIVNAIQGNIGTTLELLRLNMKVN